MSSAIALGDAKSAESYVRTLAIFFFFSLMHEDHAILNTIKILDKIKKIKDSKTKESVLIRMATDIVYDSDLSQVYITKGLNEKWFLSMGQDIGPWKEFHKNARKEEMISLLWTHVLKMEESTVLEALELNKGTHYYRISSALKKLGKITFSLG